MPFWQRKEKISLQGVMPERALLKLRRAGIDLFDIRKTQKNELVFVINKKDMQKVFGDREIAIVKELTKIHENVMRTTLCGACEYFESEDPRGEYVLILAGAEKQKEKQPVTLEQAVDIAKDLVTKGVSVNEAAKAVAADTGIKKSLIYKELL